MGFWDFIAPDFESFQDAVRPYVPAEVGYGNLTLNQDQLLALAWLNPASAAGIAARALYQNGNVQGQNQSAGQGLCNALLEQLARGGEYALATPSAGSDLTVGVGVAPIVVPNCYAATVKAVFGGKPILNTFHLLGAGAGAEVAACTALQTAWKIASGPLSRFDSKYALVEFEAVDLSSTSGGIWVITDSTTGTRASAACAGRQTTALITYNGQTRNRSQRGRTYLGPLYESDIDVDGGNLIVANQTAINTAMTNFRNSLTASGFPMVVLSRKLLTTYAITLQRTELLIATQRRRLR